MFGFFEQGSSGVIFLCPIPSLFHLPHKGCFPSRSRQRSKRLAAGYLQSMLIACSPTAILLARRKILCPVCTVDEALPVMIEEGSQWEVHARSKVHKRLAARKGTEERKQRVHILAARGKGDSTRGEPIGSADDPPIPLDGLFGT
jgi:hypothetical protein